MKILVTGILVMISVFSFAQKVNETKDNLNIKESLTLNKVKITAIQKDIAFADSAKLPTSLAVKGFVDGRIGEGLAGHNLKKTTSFGNRTDTNILVKSIFSNNIFSDSTHEADYEIVVWPDIQGMTGAYPDDIRGMGKWMRDSAAYFNVKALLQLGDITESNLNIEWMRADSAFDQVDTVGIPYLAAIGNHDYTSYSPKVANEFTTWFGPNRYANKSWKGNAYTAGDAGNNYIKFDIGSTKYLALSLDWLPKNNALDWAGRVVDSFPDRKVIVITHAYLTTYGEYSTDTTLIGSMNYPTVAGANNGDSIWYKFVRNHENIFMVINGHFLPQIHRAHGYSSYKKAIGVKGNLIHEIFVNYQRAEGPGWDNGGAGWFMRLKVSPTAGKFYITYYTSKYNKYDTSSWMIPYDIDVPTVQLNSSLSVRRGLLVNEDIITYGNLYTKIPRYAIPYIGINGKLRDTSGLTFNGGYVSIPKLAIGATTLNTTSLVDMTSTTKGLLIPRMTTAQQNAIVTPATGLLIWNLDSTSICSYNGISWGKLSGQNHWTLSGSDIYRLTKVAVNKVNAVTDSTFEVSGTMNVSGRAVIDGMQIKQSNNASLAGLSIGSGVGPNVSSTAFQNHLIGRLAGAGLTTGSQNTVFGYAAMYEASAASQSVAIGHNALRGQTAGQYNIAIGYEAMYNTTATGTGSSNIAIGRNSFKNVTTGSRNVAIGQSTLGSAVGTGSDNTLIGHFAGSNISSGASNILIGSGVAAPVATDSSQLSIGNWITGKAGSIAIGTYMAPSAKFDVQSTTQGLLIPRMTTVQMNAIVTPATGLKLYNSDAATEYAYNGTAYKSVGVISGSNDCGACAPVGTTTTTITFGGTQPNATYKVIITPGSAGMAVPFYVTNKTTTAFDVTFISPSGSGNKFDWAIYQ